MNGVAFLSVIQSPILDELADLHLVFATLGLGAIVQAARCGIYARAERALGRPPNTTSIRWGMIRTSSER